MRTFLLLLNFSIIFGIIISSVPCQNYDYEFAVDTEKDVDDQHQWGFPPTTHELFFFYHEDITELSHETSQYLEKAGVLESLVKTNVTGVWSAFHERHPTDKCHVSPISTTVMRASTTEFTYGTSIPPTTTDATEFASDSSPTTIDATDESTPSSPSITEEPCLTKDFPVISFSANNYEEYRMEIFSIFYYTKNSNTTKEERLEEPMIVFNVSTSDDQYPFSFTIPSICNNETVHLDFWIECVIYLNTLFNSTENITEIDVQFQSLLEGDVILVDKMKTNIKGPSTTRIPSSTTTTTAIRTSTFLTDASSTYWTSSTPNSENGSDRMQFHLDFVSSVILTWGWSQIMQFN